MYPPAFHKQIDREDFGPSLPGRSFDTSQRRKRILGDGRRQGLISFDEELPQMAAS
jgi:hypothetical protein